jgi:glycosyltransferase involved in cell wall biosynthesis
MERPKVSVCIPCYNHAGFLPEAIESVLAQNFSDYELLVIDDASQDETPHLLAEYAKRDARIRIRTNSTNIGMIANWNLCLKEASGEYIKFVFSDDSLSSPDALQRMVALLDSKPAVTLVACARSFIDGEGAAGLVVRHFSNGDLAGAAVINYCLHEQKNLIGEPTAVMFRKKDATRGFLPYYSQIVDQEMWFHLLERGRFAFIGDPLCCFRIHQDQQSAKNAETLETIEDGLQLLKEYAGKPYIRIGAFHRWFITCDNVYKIWKRYRAGLLPEERALAAIEKWYGCRRWRGMLPFYKLVKPLKKFERRYRRRPAVFGDDNR